MFQLRLVSIIIVLMCITGCDAPPKETDPRSEPPLVRVTKAIHVTDFSRSFTGVVASRVQSDLGFRIAGKVLERMVDTGQTVKKGQALMLLDPKDLELQVKSDEQALAAAQSRARQAAADEARYKKLLTIGAISSATYDQVKAQADITKAELRAAQAQTNVARNATEYSILTADADGVIVETFVEPGQVVSAGQTAIRLARAGQREAVIDLPETLRIPLGTIASAKLYGFSQEIGQATLRELSDTADPMTRTFKARFVLTPPLSSAPLGSTITLQISQSEHPPEQLKVPLSAIIESDKGKGPGIWVIAGEPPKASWRSVKITRISDDNAIVSGDINPKIEIVSLGTHLLREGEEVRLEKNKNNSSQGSQNNE